MVLQIARSRFGPPADGGFVTGGEFLSRTGLLDDDISQIGDPIFGSGSPLFGEGGLLGKKSREEQAILDAPDEFFAGDNKKEKDAARKNAIKAVRARQARERQQGGTQDGQVFGSGEPLLAEGGLLGPQAASQPEAGLLAEGPGFFENLTRAARPGSLANVLGRAIFGATEMERAENAAKREELTAGRSRRVAQQEVTGLLSSGTPPEEIPFGLLGRANPEATTAGLLSQRFPGQERAEPSIVRELEAAGIKRGTPEFREAILEKIRGSNASDDTVRDVELRLKALELELKQDDIRRRRETATQQTRARSTAVKADLANIKKLAKLNDSLEPTFLASGTTFSDYRRAGIQAFGEILDIAGVDGSKQSRIIAQRDAFNKLTSSSLIDSISRFGSGTITNQKLSILGESMAGPNISPDANRAIYANTIETLLNAAEQEGIDIPDATELRQLANDLRQKSGLFSDAEPSSAEAIARNTKGFDQMSEKNKQELIERLRSQLNGQ